MNSFYLKFFFVEFKILSNIVKFTSMLLITQAAFAGAMTFKIFPGPEHCQGCIVIQADGEISQETSDQFRKFINEERIEAKKDVTIVMNSLGGNLSSGLKLGEIIRVHKFNTHVAKINYNLEKGYELYDGVCASACAYAFLGGMRRSIERNSKYGLHQISVNDDVKVSLKDSVRSTQNVISVISEYVKRMGGKSEILDIATSTSDTSISWILEKDFSELNIVNSNGFIQQKSWWSYRSNSWHNDIVIEDGSIESFLLGCLPPLNKGYIDLTLFPNIILDRNDIYYGVFKYIPMRILLNGSKVIVEKNENVYFGSNVMFKFSIPISVYSQAQLNRDKFTIEISYPNNFPEEIFVRRHVIPSEGLDKAIDTLSIVCN